MTDVLGSRMLLAGFSVKGDISQHRAPDLIQAVVDEVELSPTRKIAGFSFIIGGQVGKKFLDCQPATEGMVTFEGWADFGGGYLTVASSKFFSAAGVKEVIERKGYRVTGMTDGALTLTHEMPPEQVHA